MCHSQNTIPCENYKIKSCVLSYLTFPPQPSPTGFTLGPWEPINICSAPCWVNKQLVGKTDYLVNCSFFLSSAVLLPFHCECSLPSPCWGTAETKVVFNVVYLVTLNMQDFRCVIIRPWLTTNLLHVLNTDLGSRVNPSLLPPATAEWSAVTAPSHLPFCL